MINDNDATRQLTILILFFSKNVLRLAADFIRRIGMDKCETSSQ